MRQLLSFRIATLPLLLIALFSLEGCAALGSVNQFLTSQKNPLIQAAVDAAVATAITKDPTEAKLVAARIQAIAKDVLAVDSSTVAVADLEMALNAKIGALHLPPGDMASAMILTSTLEALLNQYIAQNPGGSVTATTQVAIAGLANAVVMACGYYLS